MNDHDIQSPPVETARPRLLDLTRETIRRRHYSYRTEQAYKCDASRLARRACC